MPSDELPNARAVQDTTMWSLIDEAVSVVPARVDGIDDEAMRLCMTLRCATDVVFYDLYRTLRQVDSIAAPSLKLLLILFMYGELETRDLTRLAGMSRAATSVLLDKMATQGLIDRVESTRDRRTQVVTLSEAGRTEFVDAFTVYNERERYWADTLTADERHQLVGLLGKLVNARLDDGNLRRRQ